MTTWRNAAVGCLVVTLAISEGLALAPSVEIGRAHV